MSLMEFFYGAKIAEATVNKIKGRNKIIDDNIKDGKLKKSKRKSEIKENIDDIFCYIEREANEYIINQPEYLKSLCLGFHRPYLQSTEKSFRNMIFVFGPEGSGRKYAIRVIAKLMTIKKLIKESSIYRLDFSQYDNSETVEKLLLPDLYKAFYGKSSIILIDNFDQACSQALSYISNLGINGRIKIDKRFAWKSGKLVEATGSYEMGTSDCINANNKYIVLVSNKSQECMYNIFPRQFVDTITDITKTKTLSKEAYCTITEAFLEDCVQDLKKREDISVNISDLSAQIVESIILDHGVHDINEFIRNKIYSPVVEHYLKGDYIRGDAINIQIVDSVVWGNEIKLVELKEGDSSAELEKLDAELNQIIGLYTVKQFVWKLREHIEFNKRNKIDSSNMSLHMIFTGNPGTGKTTIARIVAKYLRALGCLSSGHLVEVSRADLVAQYMGQTAIKTAAVIKTAKGGVLFVDEAYSLVRSKEDFFGMEAVDTLVKYMEDYRDDLVVIFAGYTKEIQEFLNVNSGLKSRFNYQVEFPDYSPEEMVEITLRLAEKKKYSISQECIKPLQQYYTVIQRTNKKDSGNGRMVRNTVERAIINHSASLATVKRELSNQELYTLMPEDFEMQNITHELDIEEADKELKSIIGLSEVKEFITSLKNHIRFEKSNVINTDISYHMIFTGNPGTGKTTIARIIAKYMKGLGVLSTGQLVEVSRSDLVAGYVGQTSIKTKEVIEKAKGGILFIDEAYSLVQNPEDTFGIEAIDTLVKGMEDARSDMVVILAGYPKKMEVFLKSNLGLKSRFNYNVFFPDYSATELLEIAKQMSQEKKYSISDDCMEALRLKFERKQNLNNSTSEGNGRLVRNIVEKAIFRHSQRIFAKGSSNVCKEEMYILTKQDLELEEKGNLNFDLENEFSKIIGLDEVKNHIRSIYSLLKVNKAREKLGLTSCDPQTMHMVFTGNPGTGKTTIARLVAKILFEMEILSSDKLIETDRSSLVAGYVGQTAEKTIEILEQARGGVLFIDEAYSLANCNENDYGQEAIDTIVKYMEDYRDDLVVILAGYTKEMHRFFEMNSGLLSRFPVNIEFPDYSSEELVNIIEQMYEDNNYILGEGSEEKLYRLFFEAKTRPYFGNGRYARNLYEKSIRNQSVRINKTGVFTRETLTTIIPEDIEE